MIIINRILLRGRIRPSQVILGKEVEGKTWKKDLFNPASQLEEKFACRKR